PTGDTAQLGRPGVPSPAHRQHEREESAGPRRGGHSVQPVDQDTRREIAEIGGVPGEARGQCDTQRERQAESPGRRRARRRDDQQQRQGDPASDPDRAEVRASQHERKRCHRLAEIPPAHDAGARDRVGRPREDQDDDGGRGPPAKRFARPGERGDTARDHEEIDDQAADEGRQSQKAQPARYGRQDELVKRHLTLKAKSPSVRWPSRATTLQNTRYRPVGRAGKPTSSRVPSAGSTRESPLSTRRFSASSTRIVLKTGSMRPSNQMRTDGGDASTVWPTRGSEWSG